MKKILVALIMAVVILGACAQTQERVATQVTTETKENTTTETTKTTGTTATENKKTDIVPAEPKPAGWKETLLKDTRTGSAFKVSDFKGKPVLLESFAVWCPLCLQQQEEMKKLRTQKGDTVIEVSLDTDPNEDETIVKGHVKKHGFDWPFVVAPKEMTKALIDEFGIGIVSAPSTPVILVCGDQKTRFLSRGIKTADTLAAEIDKGC